MSRAPATRRRCARPRSPSTLRPWPQPDPCSSRRSRSRSTTSVIHEVKVGDVGLPNGYVTALRAAVGDTHPTDFWLDEPIRLELRPSDPSRPPFGSVYDRGTVEGVEDASVWLVFDVTEVSPGAVLRLTDIDVR